MIKSLAFDFGASSGRAILGKYENSYLKMEEIHRFSNDPVMINGTLYWDILRLFYEIKQGLTKCVTSGNKDIETIAIDTWGVDFALLDEKDNLISNPVHYRDARTEGVPDKFFELMTRKELYKKTGIEIMSINTLFQLYSLKMNHPEMLSRAKTLLFTPDLLSFFLTGNKSVEYTISSTSQMLNANTMKFDDEILDLIGLKQSQLPRIIMPGSVKGLLRKEICEELGIDQAKVIATASHDTQSAITSTPIDKTKRSCFISCGTWSLLGAELDKPVINEKTYAGNFTNEGGVFGTFSFMKNISGLWILQETRRQWNREGNDISFKDIDKMLLTEKSAEIFIDPDYSKFGQPGNMPKVISDFLSMTGQNQPRSKGQQAICILESLALTYRYYIEMLEKMLGYEIEIVHLIGGGVKDKNLCRYTANATGKKIVVGPVEATATGNILLQLYGAGAITSLEQARKIKTDEMIETIYPEDKDIWDKKYDKYLKIKGKN